MEQLLGSSVMSGLALMYFQSWLKRFDWYKAFVTAFPAADKYVHRMVAALGSFISAVGITYTLSGSGSDGWMLVLMIPNQATIVDAVWAFVTTFLTQQYAYDSTRRPAAMPHDQKATA